MLIFCLCCKKQFKKKQPKLWKNSVLRLPGQKVRVRHLNVLITVRRICWGFWRKRMIVSHTVLLPSWERWLWTNFVWLCLPHHGYSCPRTAEAGSICEVLRVRSSQQPVWTMNLAVWLCLTGIKTPPQSILSLFAQSTVLTLLTRFKQDWFKCCQQIVVSNIVSVELF